MRRSSVYLLTLFTLVSVFACDRVTPVAPVGSTITLSVNPTRIDAEGESALITIIVRKEDGTPVNPGTQVNVSTTLGVVDPEVAFTDETGVAKSELQGDGRIGVATVSATTGAAALVSADVQVGAVAASITLTATPSDLPKDPQGNEGVVELLALIRDDTGAPLGGSVVNFAAEIGTLDSRGGPVVTSDLGEATDVLRVSRNNISVLLDPFFEVRAETAIEGGSLIEDIVEILIRGVPATLTLQVSPATVPEAGTVDGPLRLTALVRDNLGDPLKDVGVNFITEAGTLASEGRLVLTDADGRAIDSLVATKSQLDTIPTNIFNVTAETAGLGGSLLEDVFQVRIETSEPVAVIECLITDKTDREIECKFTGSTICFGAGFARPEPEFDWSALAQIAGNPAVEQPLQDGGSTANFRLTHANQYRISLTVTDDCGSDTASVQDESVNLTP
jgi:hypothetical protein